MDDKFKDAIGKVFEERDAQKKRSEEARTDRLAKEAENLENFKKIRKEIIKPALQELADFLQEKGQPAHIAEQDSAFNKNLSKDVAGTKYSIELNLFPQNIPPQPMAPRFSFIYEESTGTVRLHVTGRNSSGQHGNPTTLAQINKNWIQEQFTSWFAKSGIV